MQHSNFQADTFGSRANLNAEDEGADIINKSLNSLNDSRVALKNLTQDN